MTDEKDILVDFSTIEKNLKNVKQVNRGCMQIPISKIVGSLGRYNDFTEGFLPHSERVSAKYESVKQAMLAGQILPPIKVYKVLDNYFVIDGHHRVTVAKSQLNAIDIDAEVIEIVFDYELSPDKKYTYNTEQARNFLIKLEEDIFEQRTFLKNEILKYPITVTELTGFGKLYEEILDFKKNYDKIKLGRKDIVYSSFLWYENRFLPAVKIILEEDLLKQFQNRTYTDLYVWIQQHKYYLSQKAGYDVGFDFTKDDFVKTFKRAKFLDVLPSLFRDIARGIKGEVRDLRHDIKDKIPEIKKD
jgi:hypothetical protein